MKEVVSADIWVCPDSVGLLLIENKKLSTGDCTDRPLRPIEPARIPKTTRRKQVREVRQTRKSVLRSPGFFFRIAGKYLLLPHIDGRTIADQNVGQNTRQSFRIAGRHFTGFGLGAIQHALIENFTRHWVQGVEIDTAVQIRRTSRSQIGHRPPRFCRRVILHEHATVDRPG